MPHRLIREVALLLLAPLAAGLVVACGGYDDEDPDVAASSLEGDIVVFAASSLTDAFTEAGAAFEAANPRTNVTFNFAASSALATQINEGAPADVFASADNEQMAVVTEAGNAVAPGPFAANRPVVVVPAGSDRVRTFADLAHPGLKVVLAAPDVPIGRYSREILSKASAANGGVSSSFSDDVLANLQSNETNVRAVLTKVQLGEADAGIVYATDIRAAAEDVVAIEIPEQYNVIAEYPIALVDESEQPDVAEAFIGFILSAEGQSIMRRFGFGAPSR